MKPKFLKPEHDIDLNAVDYWNLHHTWKECFDGVKDIEWLSDISISNDKSGKESFQIKDNLLTVTGENSLKIPIGKQFTKFMILSRARFSQNHKAAQSYIEYKYLNAHIPYMRVGTDYFKIITKKDRYGVPRIVMKGWKKEEIKQDHSPSLLKSIPTYDDFVIEPNNKKFQQVIDSCYNLYFPFSHKPVDSVVTESDIPKSLMLLRHIFGDQYDIGIQYMKVLYEFPKQPLPILCLISRERGTGKTTFLNWMQMLFGDNYIQINPEDLNSSFNSIYATKNIISIEETVIDKLHAVEKLKAITTAKTISVNQKFVANYAVPFYGKVIVCTNKEKDFMRIDEEEIRFWVRKVPVIESINTKIESFLKEEIPFLLKYLQQLPAPDFTKSRMVFTAEQLKNDQLSDIQRESWSGLRKELSLELEQLFNQNDSLEYIKATPLDIKNRFFPKDSKISASYILKVLRDEMCLHQSKLERYTPLDADQSNPVKSRGRTFTFKRSDFQIGTLVDDDSNEIPF